VILPKEDVIVSASYDRRAKAWDAVTCQYYGTLKQSADARWYILLLVSEATGIFHRKKKFKTLKRRYHKQAITVERQLSTQTTK
jgi:hypothetical protein